MALTPFFGAGVLIAAALAASAAHAYVRRGDVIVTQANGLVRLDPYTGIAFRIPVEPRLHERAGLVVVPDGDLLVGNWALPAADAGSVVRVRVREGARLPLATGRPLVTRFALARGPDGWIVPSDIDVGMYVRFPKAVARKGVLFELGPATGRVVADAGCCAYGGPGQFVYADLATGERTPLREGTAWRDPIALALSSDRQAPHVVESAVAEPGPPALRIVGLGTGAVTRVANGEPFRRPATIAHLEIGDVVGGQRVTGRAAAACVDGHRLAVARMLPAVLRRSPGRRLSCAGEVPAARRGPPGGLSDRRRGRIPGASRRGVRSDRPAARGSGSRVPGRFRRPRLVLPPVADLRCGPAPVIASERSGKHCV